MNQNSCTKEPNNNLEIFVSNSDQDSVKNMENNDLSTVFNEETFTFNQDDSLKDLFRKNRRHFCDFCDKNFKHHKALRTHLKNIHKIESGYTYFKSKVSLTDITKKTNQRIYQPNIKCPCCPSLFSRKVELFQHIRNNHEEEDVLKCGFCDKPYRDWNSLKKHLKSHLSVEINDQVYSNSPVQPKVSLLEMAEDEIDLSVKPRIYRYKCIVCGKLRQDLYQLKKRCVDKHFVDWEPDEEFILSCRYDVEFID